MISIPDLAARLRDNRYLGTLAPAHLEALAASCVVTSSGKGERLFAEGDRALGVYFLVGGEVEVTRVSHGRIHRINTLGPGALFGVMALVEGLPRSATCSTLQPSEVAMLPREAVGLLLNQSAPIAYAFQRALAGQMAHDLRASDKRLRELLVQVTK